MNYFLKLSKQRKTSYDFSNKEVSDKAIQKILETGRWAPSSLNTQPWKFVVIKNKSSIKKLVDNSYYGDFHKSPPIIIVLVIDGDYLEGEHRGVKDGKIGRTEAYLSIAMPTIQMCLEARDLGIDSCILTPNELIAKEVINADKKDQVVIMIGLGYETKKSYQKNRERKQLKELVYYEVIK